MSHCVINIRTSDFVKEQCDGTFINMEKSQLLYEFGVLELGNFTNLYIRKMHFVSFI